MGNPPRGASSVLANPKMPAIAFDWGGVLVTDGSQLVWPVLEQRLGLPARATAALWHEVLQVPADRGLISESEVWRALAQCKAGVREADVRRIFLEQYTEVPHGIRILRAAKAASWRIVLATNNVSSWLDAWSSRFEWYGLFDAICCSSDIGARKPESAYYERLKAMLPGDETYFVDDKAENLAAAEAQGFRTILARDLDHWAPPAALHANNL
jgi:HAD superfamily hydrolase (TIGR01509 family)